MIDYKWIRADMDLFQINKDSKYVIDFVNTGSLDSDFRKYACDFYDAAECVICYLVGEAARKYDIAKLDLWYFATVYLYRQSLELLLKANLFQTVTNFDDRKKIVGEVRHDLRQAFEKLIEVRSLPVSENENAKWLMDYLSDISRLDKESDMFRYPFGSNFKTLFEKQTHISLVATHDNMNRAYQIIEDLFNTGCLSEKTYMACQPKLIVEGGYYYQQSVVGYKYSKYSFYPYFSSYSKVGAFLRDVIVKEEKINLFMPMCYLYRNAIELGLKRLIVEDSHIDSTKVEQITRKKKHSIQGLWNSIIKEIKACENASDGDTTLIDAEQYIRSFHNLDKNSDLFRYPCNKNMEPYFVTAKKFDIENVASCFEELCNFLDAVDIELSRVKEIEEEMASYYGFY